MGRELLEGVVLDRNASGSAQDLILDRMIQLVSDRP